MDNDVYEKLVSLITENVLRKIDIKNIPKIANKSCMILLPNICLGLDEYLSYIIKKYEGYTIYLGVNLSSNRNFKENDKSINIVKYDLQDDDFINVLDRVEMVIVLGMKMNQMKSLIHTDDTETINHIIISRLMASKPVEMLIKTNHLFAKQIAGIITDIRNLGIEVINLQENENSSEQKVDLITERYVMNLEKSGKKTLLLDKDQLITPLAKDKLYELKIKIKYNEEDE